MIGCSYRVMIRSALVLALLMVPIGPAWASDGANDEEESAAMAAYREKTRVVRPCDRSGDAIVVCGSRAERNAAQRLPLPRESDGSDGPVRGDPARASAAPVKQGACGASGGQGAGCVGGLNAKKMIGLAIKGVTALVDPGVDLAPPPPLPDRFKGAGRH